MAEIHCYTVRFSLTLICYKSHVIQWRKIPKADEQCVCVCVCLSSGLGTLQQGAPLLSPDHLL